MPHKDPVERKAWWNNWYQTKGCLAQREKNRLAREAILDFFERKCNSCGFTNPLALQVDHVKGDGCKEKTKTRSGAVLWKKIQANPDKYQLLCANCNWIKRFLNGECPQPMFLP